MLYPVGTQRAASVTSKASKQHTKIQHCKRTLEIFEGLLNNKIQPHLIIRQIKIGTSKTSKTSQVSIFLAVFFGEGCLHPTTRQCDIIPLPQMTQILQISP